MRPAPSHHNYSEATGATPLYTACTVYKKLLIILKEAIVIVRQLRNAEQPQSHESRDEDNPCRGRMEPWNGVSDSDDVNSRKPPGVHRQRHNLPEKVELRWTGSGFRVSRGQRKSTGRQTTIHHTHTGQYACRSVCA